MDKELTSVVIVDDDDAVRESLRKTLDWPALGYRIAGIAEDGISGLELVEEFEPDIVISDILMPCMDGLTMLKEMKNRGHHPRIIILSGHDEFEYARAAINLSADAYLDKPVDREHLVETLNQTRERLENERRFSARVKDSLPLLRQAFLSRLFSGYYQELEAVREQADFLEMPLRDGPFLCIAARLDPLSPEIKKRDTLGKEFLKDAVLRLAAGALGDPPSLFPYDLGETSFMLLLEGEGAVSRDIPEISRRLEGLIHQARSRYKVPLTAGLSGFHRDAPGIAIAYQEALKALSCDHLFGTGRVISIEDINLGGSKNTWEMQRIVKGLALAVRVADMALVEEQLAYFSRQVLAGAGVPMVRIRMDAGAMAFALINEADSWLKQDRDREDARRAFNEGYEKIQQTGTVDEVVGALRTLAAAIINLIEGTRLCHHQTIIRRAAAYIETNYANNSLSLDRAAHASGVSQSHLSFLFKKKLNTSFHKYLTKIRIEKAISLLKENDFKTYEVADMVGYSNAQYFSVSFKKYTGFSPLQFRSGGPEPPEYSGVKPKEAEHEETLRLDPSH
jgi:two-component system response regulator YesN